MLKFLGIGAQKAGTTWLYEMLKEHPQIYIPETKEHHFWNAHYNGKNFDDYDCLFNREGLCGGEITPAYGHLPIRLIKEIFEFKRNLRLIYILRNPIDRAWSSALMELHRAGFDYEAVGDSWFREQYLSEASLQRGDYIQCIKNWRSFFPEQQLLILKYEHIATSPEEVLKSCCHHLEVEDYSDGMLIKINPKRRVFTGLGYPIPHNFKTELQELYNIQIQSLSEYLEEDFSPWLI